MSDAGDGISLGINGDALKRFSLGDKLGTTTGQHDKDPAKAAAPTSAGSVATPASGGEAVWVNRLTPAERALTDFRPARSLPPAPPPFFLSSLSLMSTPTPLTDAELTTARAALDRLVATLQTVLFGQEELIELTVSGVLARGHLLLEGLPGLGKTELVKGLAHALGLHARRVQFTPDLLPGDITGNPVLEETPAGRRFVFQRGPVFANILLADEINRASPKTQSALLEAMQERRVTAGGETHALPDPFFVLATQNPIDLEGTYPLPEAQLDRFLFKLNVHSNPPEVLKRIVLQRELGTEP
eukprot:gene8943-12087_t